MPAISAMRPAHAPAALTVTRASTSVSWPVLAHARARDLIAVAADGDRAGTSTRAPLGAARHRPHHFPDLDVGTRNTRDPRVQERFAQRLRRLDLLHGTPVARQPAAIGIAGSSNGVATKKPCPRCTGGDLAQDHVLGDALLGGVWVLDRVRLPECRSPWKRPLVPWARRRIDEHDVDAAQWVPRHVAAGAPPMTRTSVGGPSPARPIRLSAGVVAAVDASRRTWAHRARLVRPAAGVAHAAQSSPSVTPGAAKKTSLPATRSSVLRTLSRS